MLVLEDIEKDPKGFVDKAKNKTHEAVEHGKTGLEQIGEEFKDIVDTAEEVGKEIWEDVKEIFGQGDKQGEKEADEVVPQNKTEKVGSPKAKTNTSVTAHNRRAFTFL
jgi:vacuolar-type H+-ATPase subunit H